MKNRMTAFAALIISIVLLTGCATRSAEIEPITNEQGYKITGQEEYDFTVSIPKSELPDSIYTSEGHTFDKDEIIVYETETTTIYLESVNLHFETHLRFCFGFFFTAVPDNGSIFLPCRVRNGATGVLRTYYECLRNNDLTDSTKVYSDAVFNFGGHTEKQLSFYVLPDVYKEAEDVINIEAYVIELTYEKEK